MDKRTEKQIGFAQDYTNYPKDRNGHIRGILYLCPRFGKISTSIYILNNFKFDKILIAYPEINIKKSWEKDFLRLKYTNSVTFTTHKSLDKHSDQDWDIVILDEIHLLSENQINVCKKFKTNILGLTGTMSKWTKAVLKNDLNLPVISTYTIDQAISDNVITDYEITVKMVDLDNKVINNYKGKKRTEKGQFNALTAVISSLESLKKNTFFLKLARMRLIINSLAKLEATKKILKENKNERILIFCGDTKNADKLGCPTHHSKNRDKSIDKFDSFAEGDSKNNHMAVVKIGNTGITYKPLDKVIVNYFDSNPENLAQKINRCMALEYNNPDKKSYIWIISSTEEAELNWLKKALEFFDKSKVKYEKM